MLACVCLLVRTCLVPGLCTWGCIHACKRVYVPIHTCRRTMNTQIFFLQKSQSTHSCIFASVINTAAKKKRKKKGFGLKCSPNSHSLLQREMCRYVSCHDVYGERNAGYTASHSWLHTSQHSCQHHTCHHFRCQRRTYQHLYC